MNSIRPVVLPEARPKLASTIPIENIYYLLAYAWDLFQEAEECPVDVNNCPDVHNLLAAVLANGIHSLMRRGIDKGYCATVEVTPRIRGRIDILSSYRRLTQLSGIMQCEFDELTADTLPNKIIKSTCRLLLVPSSPLTKRNRIQIRLALDQLHGISEIRLSSRSFARVQLHRNNRHYRLLLSVCRLIVECFLPDENESGRRFRSLMDDDRLMNRIFEKFVRNFARRYCKDASVGVSHIKWFGEWDEEFDSLLPLMKTDVTLERTGRTTILDCKYYKEALVKSFDKSRLHPGHLYQLNAYLQNSNCHEPNKTFDGILLYPSIDSTGLHATFNLLGKQVRVESINLDQPWQCIESELKSILD
jgi:5-methylcytosine-specific restriction enzyme subunit McrC